MGTKWEYCILDLTDRWIEELDDDTDEATAYSYSVVATFSYGGTVRGKTLARRKEIKESSPFEKALGKLGADGWELVSVQHGVSSGNISGCAIVAYFKRQFSSDHSMDEPFANIVV